MLKIAGLFLLILSIILVNSCKKDKPTPPSINTSDVTAISYTTATSGGNLTNEGSSAVLSMGICWNTSTGPTIDNSKTIQNGALGAFVSNIVQLTQNTKYFVRAYATNTAGTSYGNEVIFTTIQIAVPALTTAAITNITQTSSVTGGNITSDNGAPILARGICWSTSVNPTTTDNKTIDGADIGNFVSNLTGLIGNTLYYVRAYATNSVGTQYGNQVSFTTSPLMPTITSTSISSITQTTASSGGNVTTDGGAIVSTTGVCWNTTSGPTIVNSKTVDAIGTGIFISTLTGLTANTTYYLRAYATNSVGTAYGSEISFTTLQLAPPVLTTTEVSSLLTTTANSGGSVTSDGGSPITVRGVCWNTAQNPTTDNNKTIDGTGSGNFTSNIAGLLPNTTYYLRSYATNNIGTSYGNDLIFKTFSFIDVDGNGYHSVVIGTQTWMAENLKTTKYINGDLIGTTTPATMDISGEDAPKYQWSYLGNESNVDTYGRLYTWYSLTDIRSVCPTGWHVPTSADFTTLINFVGDFNTAGGILKETGTSHFLSPNTGATNAVGFTSLPAGYRNIYGLFGGMTDACEFWTSSEVDGTNATMYSIFSGSGAIGTTEFDKKFGMSIRCIKDY